MLMPVDQQSGLVALDVLGQRHEAGMDAIRLVVDAKRGIVRDEHIHVGKIRQHLLHFLLRAEEMALRFVFPRAAQAAKGQPAELGDTAKAELGKSPLFSMYLVYLS